MKKIFLLLLSLLLLMNTAVAENYENALDYLQSLGYTPDSTNNTSGVIYCDYVVVNSKTATLMWSDATNSYEIKGSNDDLPQLYINMLMMYQWDSCSYKLGKRVQFSINSSVKSKHSCATYDEYVERTERALGVSGQAPIYRVLEKGSKGDDVIALQQRLIDLYYLSGKADGDYGNKTKEAVMRFQEAAHLSKTGTADQTTQTALFSDDAPKATLDIQSGTISFGSEARTAWSVSGYEFTLSGNETRNVETPWGTFHFDAYGNYEKID